MIHPILNAMGELRRTAAEGALPLAGLGLGPSRRRPAILVRSLGLGFLGGSPFAAKTPADEGWIYLGFLGFSRPNLDLSMGYAA